MVKESDKTNIFVFLLFLILSLILTYPLILDLNNALNIGDASLNTWILSWDIKNLMNNPLNLFNGNIFYPFNENSLAFSEHMIATSLMALPITILFNNPILSYNIIFIMSFVLSGFGMYLLVYHIIRDKNSAIISGLIFAFSAYRFAHLGHLQILTVQWIPFLMLYLDKFFNDRTYKNLLIFYVFFVLQVLSSWYLAFYSMILVGLYILYQFISKIEIRSLFFNRKFQIKIIFFIIITLLVVLPFAFPYIEISRNYGFVRSIQENEYYSADIVDYMFTAPSNMLYGDISKIRGSINWGEHSLFLGFTSLFIAVYGLLPLIRHPLREYRSYRNQIFYVFLVVIAFILTLGPRLHINGYQTDIILPYNYLYNYLPGFNSMRVPSRFIVLVVFGISILSGYGAFKLIKRFENKYGKDKVFILFIGIAFLILIESIYIPIGYGSLPTGNSIPEVYKWLANEKGDFAIAELPTGYFTQDGNNLWYDTKYMYYSTYHWKKLVNGYSGFFPDGYIQILNQLQEFPSEGSINLLKGIPVKYVIIHSSEIDRQRWNRILNDTSKYKELKIIKILGTDYVFQIESGSDALQRKSIPLISLNAPSIIRKDDRFTASISLFNDNNYTYVNQPKLIIETSFFERNNSSAVNIIKLQSQVIINPNETFNIPISMKSPKFTGDYMLNITVKSESYEKTLQIPIIVKENISDSVSSNRVHALYNSYNIPKIIVEGTRFKVNINATNDGDVLWRAKVSTPTPIGEVHLGNRWSTEEEYTWTSERGLIPYDIAPGQNATIEMLITAPNIPGRYILKLDLVDEGVIWFEQQGAKPISQVIDVIQ